MTTNNIMKVEISCQEKEVEISIKKLLESLRQSPSNPCIRKVPESYAKQSKCYEPSIVSIGPLHYNTKLALKSFHEMKVRHLQCFLELGNKKYALNEYIGIVKEQEERIRSYYAEKSTLSNNEYIEMILLDAAFIIVFFLGYNNEDKFQIGMPPVVNRLEVLVMVKQDIFLVENQLPFFILNDLYDKAFGEAYPNNTFIDVTCSFLSCSCFPGTEAAGTTTYIERIRKASNINHLVDLLRICCLPCKLRDDDDPPKFSISQFPKSTVKELKAAGVEFRTSESSNLLDITFSKGVLHIPKLIIQDSTEHVLRSIVFLEQCHHSNDSYMVDYIAFMDGLIDTPEDVQILVQNGILENMLGSDEEVATLFNQICKDVSINNPRFYYAQQSKELNAYVDTRWNKWKGILKRDYFNHPWSVISLIYAVVLLILTVLQVYTGYKAINPSIKE